MFGIVFRVEAQPGKRQEWIDHINWVAEVAKKDEPATLRFEMYPDPNDDNAFFVYEAYEDEAGFEAHKQGEPYKRWASERKKTLVTNLEIIFVSHSVTTMVD